MFFGCSFQETIVISDSEVKMCDFNYSFVKVVEGHIWWFTTSYAALRPQISHSWTWTILHYISFLDTYDICQLVKLLKFNFDYR